MTPAVRAQVLSEFGLDKPLDQQYVLYLANLTHGNVGLSFFYRQPFWSIIGDRLLNSVRSDYFCFVQLGQALTAAAEKLAVDGLIVLAQQGRTV